MSQATDSSPDDPSEIRFPLAEFHTRRRIEFADTDMARIVHFSRFFDFMEAAEHEFLRTLLGDGREVHFEHEGHEIGWPRAKVEAEFHSPATLGDVVDIRVRVVRKGQKSMTYRFDLSIGERRVATGSITAICCRLGGERLKAVPIPPDLADRIAEYPFDAPTSSTSRPTPILAEETA